MYDYMKGFSDSVWEFVSRTTDAFRVQQREARATFAKREAREGRERKKCNVVFNWRSHICANVFRLAKIETTSCSE